MQDPSRPLPHCNASAQTDVSDPFGGLKPTLLSTDIATEFAV